MGLSKSAIRANLIYGAIALLPVLIVAYVIFKVYGVVEQATKAVTPLFGGSDLFGTGTIAVMTVVGLLLVCTLVGALVRSQIASGAFEKVQSKFGDVIPAYEIVTNLLRGIAGNKKSYPPALINLFAPGTAVLGFVMEDTGMPYVTIFVPSTPVLTVGSVHIVERSRVQMIDGTAKDAAECAGQWGLGMQELCGPAVPRLLDARP